MAKQKLEDKARRLQIENQKARAKLNAEIKARQKQNEEAEKEIKNREKELEKETNRAKDIIKQNKDDHNKVLKAVAQQKLSPEEAARLNTLTAQTRLTELLKTDLETATKDSIKKRQEQAAAYEQELSNLFKANDTNALETVRLFREQIDAIFTQSQKEPLQTRDIAIKEKYLKQIDLVITNIENFNEKTLLPDEIKKILLDDAKSVKQTLENSLNSSARAKSLNKNFVKNVAKKFLKRVVADGLGGMRTKSGLGAFIADLIQERIDKKPGERLKTDKDSTKILYEKEILEQKQKQITPEERLEDIANNAKTKSSTPEDPSNANLSEDGDATNTATPTQNVGKAAKNQALERKTFYIKFEKILLRHQGLLECICKNSTTIVRELELNRQTENERFLKQTQQEQDKKDEAEFETEETTTSRVEEAATKKDGFFTKIIRLAAQSLVAWVSATGFVRLFSGIAYAITRIVGIFGPSGTIATSLRSLAGILIAGLGTTGIFATAATALGTTFTQFSTTWTTITTRFTQFSTAIQGFVNAVRSFSMNVVPRMANAVTALAVILKAQPKESEEYLLPDDLRLLYEQDKEETPKDTTPPAPAPPDQSKTPAQPKTAPPDQSKTAPPAQPKTALPAQPKTAPPDQSKTALPAQPKTAPPASPAPSKTPAKTTQPVAKTTQPVTKTTQPVAKATPKTPINATPTAPASPTSRVPVPPPTPQSNIPSASRQNLNDPRTEPSEELIDIVRKRENWELRNAAAGTKVYAYKDNKQYSIGYGIKANSKNEVITKEEAERRLRKRLSEEKSQLIRLRKTLGRNWTDKQVEALTSFVFNTGIGKLNQLTDNNTRTDQEIADAMLKYNKELKGKNLTKNPGLLRRREEERREFLNFDVPDNNQMSKNLNNKTSGNFTDPIQKGRRGLTEQLARSSSSSTMGNINTSTNMAQTNQNNFFGGGMPGRGNPVDMEPIDPSLRQLIG